MIHAILTRAQYVRSMAAGARYKAAEPWELGRDPSEVFYYVERTDGFCVLKRQL